MTFKFPLPVELGLMCMSPHSLPKRRAPKRPFVIVNKAVMVKHSTQLSVVSYNLLAQDLLEKNMHLYTQCSPDQLKWDFRKNNLLDDLTQSSADVGVVLLWVRCHWFTCGMIS